nr:uncharacterized protein LOC106615426 isoform X1 [Bactrocera oleae]XP_014087108.1 uncharacterized protein LOC106615426 isoform X2 [Bactrocera oleae]
MLPQNSYIFLLVALLILTEPLNGFNGALDDERDSFIMVGPNTAFTSMSGSETGVMVGGMPDGEADVMVSGMPDGMPMLFHVKDSNNNGRGGRFKTSTSGSIDSGADVMIGGMRDGIPMMFHVKDSNNNGKCGRCKTPTGVVAQSGGGTAIAQSGHGGFVFSSNYR